MRTRRTSRRSSSSSVPRALREALTSEKLALRDVENTLHVTIEGDAGVGPLLTRVLAAGATVVEVEPERETLEDLFVRKAMSTGD